MYKFRKLAILSILASQGQILSAPKFINNLIYTKPDNGISGLENNGNTCFMNAAIQCMANIKPFKDYLTSKNFYKNNTISSEFINLLKSVGTKKTVNPSKFTSKMWQSGGFTRYACDDSSSVLDIILDRLSDIDIPKEKSKAVKQDFRNFFGFQAQDTITCKNCFHQSKVDAFMTKLELPITGHHNLDQCLEHYFGQEDLSVKMLCSKCKTQTTKYKQTNLKEAPNYLILTLKRFGNNRETLYKKTNPISFPLHDLNLSKYLSSKSDSNYELISIIEHIGSFAGGHYTAYVKSDSGKWFHCNDNYVGSVSENQIRSLTNSGAPYILFYRKKKQHTFPTIASSYDYKSFLVKALGVTALGACALGAYLLTRSVRSGACSV